MSLRALKSLIALLLIVSPILAQKECWEFIHKLERNKHNQYAQSLEEEDYFAFSGTRGVNDLGKMAECQSDPKRRYFVITEITHAPKELNSKSFREEEVGICLPKFCTAKDLGANPFQLLVLSRINNWRPKGALSLYDPNTEPPRGRAFYVIVGVFFALVALTLIATIIQNIKGSQDKSSFWHRYDWLFKSFDARENLTSLCMTAKEAGQSEQISTFGFLRVFAIIQFIGHHVFGIFRLMQKANWPASFPDSDNFFIRGDTAVGYFFFVGGFLAAFNLANRASILGTGVFRFFSDMMRKLFKIYPGLWVTTLLYWIVLPGLTNGPLWNRYIGEIQVCEERWMQKLLMIDNLKPQEFNYCAGWTWWINVEFQVYAVIIVLAYMFVSKNCSRHFVYLITLVMIGASFYIGMTIVKKRETIKGYTGTWHDYTPARAGEILIGVFFGLQYFEYSKLKLTSNFNAWCEKHVDLRYFSLILGVLLNYYGMFVKPLPTSYTPAQWEYLRRLFISLGTAFIFVPFANNCYSVLKWVMNLRVFHILNRLCFGAYLMHCALLYLTRFTMEDLLAKYDHRGIVHQIFRTFTLAFAAAFVYYLILEKPLLNIENAFTKVKIVRKPTAVTSEGANPSKGYVPLSESVDRETTIELAMKPDDDDTVVVVETPTSHEKESSVLVEDYNQKK